MNSLAGTTNEDESQSVEIEEERSSGSEGGEGVLGFVDRMGGLSRHRVNAVPSALKTPEDPCPRNLRRSSVVSSLFPPHL